MLNVQENNFFYKESVSKKGYKNNYKNIIKDAITYFTFQ